MVTLTLYARYGIGLLVCVMSNVPVGKPIYES